MSKVNIIFEDGHIFVGERFGADTDAIGEVVFTTSSASYIEDITDPCSKGQIIMPTFPSLGNYGMIFQDRLSDGCQCAGVITRSLCAEPSNFRSEGKIEDYLRAQGVPGISGVDTRAITRLLLTVPSMRAAITTKPPEEVMLALKSFYFNGYREYSGTHKYKSYSPDGETSARVALIDLGAPARQLKALLSLGCEVCLFPMGVSLPEVLADGCSGAVFSEGPGDPEDYAPCIQGIDEFFGELPLFGVGLGHQLMALAQGARTYRLKAGHRGGNVPVRGRGADKVNITTQNHSYAVASDPLPPSARVLYDNRNDGSIEGLLYEGARAFSLQFHPGNDSRAPEWNCKSFIDMLED